MPFTFKRFHIDDSGCGMKVGTDSVLLGAWAETEQAKTIADIGSGSGLLALMCAQRNPHAKITAVEIDADACAQAKRNIDSSPWSSRIAILNADALCWQPAQKFDLIISNPPYFSSSLISPHPARAQARHGAGLSPGNLLRWASDRLSPVGILAMVTPADMEQDLIFEGALARLNLRRICHVRTSDKKPFSLILTQWSPASGTTLSEVLSLSSPAYRALTADFYLDK